ncbi:MAG: LemA family protein [Alphaproteobacteria bacterium]|nr:LemA family protein [Alphaproteobacteria bacterium]MCD8563114.1 LemA family protein [Alphaproteobacteria bacterium]
MDYAVILGVLAVIALGLVTIYNRLVALRQTRSQAFADIDVQLKQRFDLIPNLLETVKGYASHEKEVLEHVTEARASVGRAGNNTDARIKAEGALSGALMGLFAVAENYPDLKADQNFRQFMAELSDIENKLAAARRFFNNATSEYNTAIQSFPAVLLAGPLGFTHAEFFEVGDDAARAQMDKAPDVKFG